MIDDTLFIFLVYITISTLIFIHFTRCTEMYTSTSDDNGPLKLNPDIFANMKNIRRDYLLSVKPLQDNFNDVTQPQADVRNEKNKKAMETFKEKTLNIKKACDIVVETETKKFNAEVEPKVTEAGAKIVASPNDKDTILKALEKEYIPMYEEYAKKINDIRIACDSKTTPFQKDYFKTVSENEVEFLRSTENETKELARRIEPFKTVVYTKVNKIIWPLIQQRDYGERQDIVLWYNTFVTQNEKKE